MKTYLGDGVYAEIVEGSLRLTTEDGIRTTNEIILEFGMVKRTVGGKRVWIMVPCLS